MPRVKRDPVTGEKIRPANWAPKKMGRPTLYSDEMVEYICMRVATSEMGLPRLCKKHDDMPDEETIRRWLYTYPNFRGKYAQAKVQQAELLAEQIVEISDESNRDMKINENGYETIDGEVVARSRLRVDTRKWLASKLIPRLYGNIKEIEDEREKNEILREEVRALRAQLDEKNKRDY